MPQDWTKRLEDVLRKLDDQKISRAHTAHELSSSTLRTGDGLRVFASNDYLGLAGHPEMRWVAAETTKMYGMGARASSLMSGYSPFHAKLEAKLAQLTKHESALLFPTGRSIAARTHSKASSASGFAANTALLSALSEGGEVAIFSDELNHASIIDGTQMAKRHGALVYVYRHGDVGHLEEQLLGCRTRHKIVVTETLFSMDGDFVDLRAIVDLKRRHSFLLVVDEAHTMLVAGDTGGGYAEECRLQHRVDVVVGTLSKAFGCMGGFVCGTANLRRFLASRGRPHIFSTALPLPIAAAAIRAIDIAQREAWRAKHLRQLIHYLATRLGIAAESWIIPVTVGSAANALRLSQALRHDGFWIPAIRPPTVAPETCRIRISLSADHSFEDLDHLVHSLQLHQAAIKHS